MASITLNAETSFDVKEKIWRGPKRETTSGTDVSLGRSVLEALLKNPENISQICDNNGRQYTNQEIATLSIRVAQHLEEIGIQQEDIIGICAANTDFLTPLVFGSLLCGAALSTVDPSFDKDSIRHIFSITKPKLMFCDGKVFATVQAALAEVPLSIPTYTMKDHLEGVKQIDELIAPTGREQLFKVKPLKLGSRQTAAILCSSGTTGLPKGVCMSHESLLIRSSSTNVSLVGDTILYFITVYWVSGFTCLFQGTFAGLTRVMTDHAFSPELFLRMVEQYKIKYAYTAPSQMAMAVQSPVFKQRNLTSLETYFCGGSSVPFAVIENFLAHVKGCKVITSYALSETSGVCCLGIPTKPGVDGQPIANFEIKIIDESGKNLGISESGEVCIKPPFKWAGYYNNKEATDAIYDQEGWIHSGDIGYFDDRGSLFIIDRIKDILKYKNFHFFPTEIEEVILQIPEVIEVCVCGIPDIISSFLPAAAVVKVPGSQLTEEEVRSYVANRMVHFKQLRGGVYFLDSLPKTASGKNIRAKITKMVEAMRDQQKRFNQSANNHDNISESA